MTNISDQIPCVPVSIQCTQNSSGTIQNFFSDFTVFPSYILNTSIGFPSNANNTRFYESGLTIAQEESGGIIISNNADIDIDSPISLMSNLTVISYNGSINISQNITTSGRIVLMAPQGTIIVASESTIHSETDRIILSANTIENLGAITSFSLETILASPQNAITNNGTITANRIVAQHIGGSGSLYGDQIVADNYNVSTSGNPGSGSGTLLISSSYLTSTSISSRIPNTDGVALTDNDKTYTIVTNKNVSIPSKLSLSKNLKIITTGQVSIPNGIDMNGMNLTIIAGQISTGDLDVSNDLSNGFPSIGSISLYALADITTGNLIADISCDGVRGADVVGQTGSPGAPGYVGGGYQWGGAAGELGGVGNPGQPPLELPELIGTPITVIACNGELSISNISAMLSAQGGDGGSVINCVGGQGGAGLGGGGQCGWSAGTAYGLSMPAGCGGVGGHAGAGGDGAQFKCVGSSVALIANQGISVAQSISLEVNTSGGNGGDLVNCSGGVGGGTPQAGWEVNGSAGGVGGSVGIAGSGGNAGILGKAGNVTILTADSITISDLQCNAVNNGGNGGNVSGAGGDGGDGGDGGGDCTSSWDFTGFGPSIMYGGNGGDGGDGGTSGNGGNSIPLVNSTSIIIGYGKIELQNVGNNQYNPGTTGVSTGQPGAGGAGGDGTNTTPASDGNTGASDLSGVNGSSLGTPSSAPIVLISYESIVVPDIVSPGFSDDVPFFESLVGLCGSGSITFGQNTAQLNAITSNLELGGEVSFSSASQDEFDNGTVTIVSPDEQKILNTLPACFSPSFADEYQVFFNPNQVSGNITALTQNVQVEEIQVSLFVSLYVYPGKLRSYPFGVTEKNTSGTLVAALTFSDQVFEQTITAKDKIRIFYGNGNSGVSGVYVAEYDVGTSDLNNIQFFNLQCSGVNSVYFDPIFSHLYFVSSSNELGYADVNNVGVVSSPSILNTSSFTNSFGLFLDRSNNKIYWVNNGLSSIGSIIYGSIYVADINNVDGNPSFENPLVLDQSASPHSSFFLDVQTGNAYWTNDKDNSLWTGVVDSLGNPTQISSQRYLYSFSNQVCGLYLDITQGTIYWLIQDNGGELWRGSLDNVSDPSSILSPTLLYSNSFGTSDNPTNTPSGFCFSFLSQGYYFNNVETPLVSGTYPISITVYDSDLPQCSDTVQKFISVPGIILSDVQFPSSVLAGSNFEVSFVVNMQDPLNSDPSGYFEIFGFDSQQFNFQGIWQNLSDILQVPNVSKTQEYKFSIQVIHQESGYQIQSDFSVMVSPLTVQAVASPQSIISGETIDLSVENVLSDVTYSWTSNDENFDIVSSDTVYNVSPPAGKTTVYTVTAQNGLVEVQSSVSVCASSMTVIHPNIPWTVIAGSNFSVGFDVDIQGEGQVSDAFITFNTNTYYLGASDTYQYTLVAPCTPSDYSLRIQVYDTIGASATYLDNSIEVQPLLVVASASLSDITPGQFVDLSVVTVPVLSDVSYVWTNNTNQIIQNSDMANASSSPSITTSYTVIATNGLCSFSDTITINVAPYIVLSDVSYVPSVPVAAGSLITVSFTPNIFNGNVNSTTVVAKLSMGNNHSQFYISDGVQANLNFNTNCMPGPLTIFAYDHSDRSCSTSDIIPLVNVIPLTVTAMASPQLLYLGQTCILSVSDPVSDASYSWYQGVTYISSDATTIRENIGNSFETYTVIAQNGSCCASDFITVGVAAIEIPSTHIPEQMCAGSVVSDVFFQIEAFNGSGTVSATATFNNQTVFSSDINYTWQMFFADGSNASTAGVYMSQFIPLLNGPINTTFLTMSTFANNAINSVYFDAVNQNLYCVYADNQLWVISTPQSPTPSSYPITVSDLDNPYGLFVDSTNGYIYWVNADSDTINVAQISNLNDPANITVGSSSVLLSGVGLNEPSGFFLDTTTQNAYWTNLSDNSLWYGQLNNLSDPTTITSSRSALQLEGGLNQPTGVVVNPQDGTIYWMNSVNGGELWQAELWPNLINPTKLNNARLLSSGNFGTTSDPNMLPSGLCITFPSLSRELSIAAPLVGGNYPLTITFSDSDLCSNSITTNINVTSIIISDLSISDATVTSGSNVCVSFIPIVTGGASDQALVTLSFSDFPVFQTFTVSDSQPTTLSILAPCVSSDIVTNLSLTVQSFNNQDSFITSDIPITIQPLNVEILAYLSDFITPIPSDTIMSGQEIILSIANPVPGASYSWSGNINSSDTIISDTPEQTTTYTVIVSNGSCWNIDSTTINVNTPGPCVLLSDVQFTVSPIKNKYNRPTGSFELTITGYQFSKIPGASRTIQLSNVYSSYTNTSFTSDNDSFFSFLSIVLSEAMIQPILTAFISDNPLCVPTIISDIPVSSKNQKTFTINFAGSVLTPAFHLPHDLTDSLDGINDLTSIFNTMCTYAGQQTCNRFAVGLEILEHSDVLPIDSSILHGMHMAFVFCSDNNFYAQEMFQGFTFVLNNILSDAVTINHTDSVHGSTTKVMQKTGFSLTVSSDKIKWWSPYVQSLASLNVNTSSILIDEQLLTVSGNKNLINNIDGFITCLPICNTLTSDAQYVCELYQTAKQVEKYLGAFYPNYSDLPISDKNYVTYIGDIVASRVLVDLNCGKINFSDLSIQGCSDLICF